MSIIRALACTATLGNLQSPLEASGRGRPALSANPRMMSMFIDTRRPFTVKNTRRGLAYVVPCQGCQDMRFRSFSSRKLLVWLPAFTVFRKPLKPPVGRSCYCPFLFVCLDLFLDVFLFWSLELDSLDGELTESFDLRCCLNCAYVAMCSAVQRCQRNRRESAHRSCQLVDTKPLALPCACVGDPLDGHSSQASLFHDSPCAPQPLAMPLGSESCWKGTDGSLRDTLGSK